MEEVQIWYKVETSNFLNSYNHGNFIITEIKVVKETENQIIILINDPFDFNKQNKKRVNKISIYDAYFPTKKEAFDWKLNLINSEIKNHEMVIKDLKRASELMYELN